MPDRTGTLLITERLYCRWWQEDDLPLATLLWGDDEVTRYMGGSHSAEQIRRRFDRQREWAGAHNFQYWAWFERATDEFIGCCGLKPYDLAQGVLEHGFHLRPLYWGRGYGWEAARAVLDHAFETLGARSIFAGRHPHNDASHRLLVKLGFVYTHDEFFATTGLMHPSYRLDATVWRHRSERRETRCEEDGR